MKQHHNPALRPAHFLTLAIVPGSFCLASPAIAETLAGVTISLSGKASSNPYLQAVSQSGVAGEVQIDPWLQFLNENSKIELRGTFNGSAYTNGNGTDRSARVELSAQRELSPYFSVHAAGSYANSNAGAQNALLMREGPADQVPPPLLPTPDTSFVGFRTKVEAIDARIGAAWTPSLLDSVSVDFGAVRSRSGSNIGADYDSYSASLGYARKLSRYTSATADVAVTKSNYLGMRTGDGTIITPRIGLRHQINRRFSISGNIGASLSRTHRADGSLDKFTTLSGSVSLCNTGERSSFCLNVSRAAEPRAIGGITPVTSGSLTFDHKLSLRDSLTFTASYSKNEGTPLSGGALKFYGISSSLTHSFNPRFVAFVTPSFARSEDSFQPNRQNYQVSVGLRYSFGVRP